MYPKKECIVKSDEINKPPKWFWHLLYYVLLFSLTEEIWSAYYYYLWFAIFFLTVSCSRNSLGLNSRMQSCQYIAFLKKSTQVIDLTNEAHEYMYCFRKRPLSRDQCICQFCFHSQSFKILISFCPTYEDILKCCQVLVKKMNPAKFLSICPGKKQQIQLFSA